MDTEIQSVFEINDAAVKAFGYSKEDIIARFVEEITPQKEHQKLLQLSAAVTSEKQSVKKRN